MPGRALFILIDGAQNVRRRFAFRIMALAFGMERDPVEMHLLQPIGFKRIDPAASPTGTLCGSAAPSRDGS